MICDEEFWLCNGKENFVGRGFLRILEILCFELMSFVVVIFEQLELRYDCLLKYMFVNVVNVCLNEMIQNKS